ncbi:FAD/NAD(P)-binding domain-containing protein [Fragilariopsis cylindrus CCMP1102]|uniref:FAD/NAD(P)-binding domain-containing protein n=1 Tax=Fragilariopsis cylindrus CCMP1102 TaxID=635003 RepID=A0A1E7F394_9STRA|nr:FAD/NAD(P)-binding domain-containing protein [Fragilariopsis cylindrus CCMP1102]|eukprot:OEU12323.1 FAD/NAD(P)-binding domain-containing protein [Fragilariopsis cylindrus CCMP1102]
MVAKDNGVLTNDEHDVVVVAEDEVDVEQEDQNAPKLDEEGLLEEYDIVICGTGLVQSIVASALARAGKSILHCDGNDYYGEMDAVWTMSMIQEFLDKEEEEKKIKNTNNNDSTRIMMTRTSNVSLIPDGGKSSSFQWHYPYCSSSKSENDSFYLGIRVGSEVKTPHGNGVVRSIRRHSDSSTLEIELNKWKLTNDQSPIIYVRIPEFPRKNNTNDKEEDDDDDDDDDGDIDAVLLEDILLRTKDIRSIQSIERENILKQGRRSLAFDATPSFVLANGLAVQSMLASGVADYLEFKPVDGLYWLEQRNNCHKKRNNSNSNNKEVETNDETAFELSRVPCSKNDIFSTKLLAPMEKRRFMKFIQLSMDYATKIAAEEELRNNEENDNDNNNNNNDDDDDDDDHRQDKELDGNEVKSLNERHLNQGRSLARPQNKMVDTGELKLLQEAIQNESMTFDDFLMQKYKLSDKLRNIIRYALALETNASDSSNSLSQGMKTLQKHLQALGRYGTTAFLVPMYGSGELSQAFCRSAAVFGATYLLRRRPLAIKGFQQQRICKTPKTIKCSHVVLPVNTMGSKYFEEGGRLSPIRRIVRRISVLSGKVIPSDSGEQRHVIFIPPDDTIGNIHAIHGVLLDNSVSVAPRGCTLFHLTTTVTDWVSENDEIKTEAGRNHDDPSAILERAQASVLKSKLTTASSQKSPIELYHVSFSHECPQLDETEMIHHPDGIHFCKHTGQELTADVAFEQAQKIFSSICPGAKFMGLSIAIDEVIRDRAEEKGYDDDEKNMLESAVGMIEDNTISTAI